MARRIVVMGVSGAGKSTLGAALAASLGAPFVDGDALHPPANVAKMAAGRPLDDADRWPWLASVRQALRREDDAVVACSALKRSYRDALRSAGEVCFLDLQLTRAEAVRRLRARTGHFMGPGMVDGQLAALEPPEPDETDVARIDATGTPEEVLAAMRARLESLRPGTAAAPLLAEGAPERAIGGPELDALVEELVRRELGGAGRVLLVPPDHTRLHSRAGEITALLHERLTAGGAEVTVLPATGTHRPMAPAELELLFGGRVPHSAVAEHRGRSGLVRIGEIAAEEVAAVSGGRFAQPIPVEVDELLLRPWDLVVSAGQVVPHEVTGMANFTKNLVIGLGGGATVHRSHFLGAVCGLESIMGRAQTAVRDVVDAAFDRFLAARAPVLWLLTVMEDTPAGVVQRGLFAGTGGSGGSGGAAYRAAAALSARCNIELVPQPLGRIGCFMDEAEFRSSWLANKAVYRTRMAIADGGELIVLAPGVTRFGEDDESDALIRRHGFRGTAATLAAVEHDPRLAESLGAAAHLIHGSSEGRFRIVYCTDPGRGGLTREEVEHVGYEWRPLRDELDRLGCEAATPSGPRVDRDGVPYAHVANAALGLWASAARFP